MVGLGGELGVLRRGAKIDSPGTKIPYAIMLLEAAVLHLNTAERKSNMSRMPSGGTTRGYE
jgi:hypothetical protein